MIVLDTHVWIWWISNPAVLTRQAVEAIDEAIRRDAVYVSAISVWEIALLVHKGRLEMTRDVGDWIRLSESLPFLKFVPVDNTIALQSVRINDNFHEDPADRIIVATAMATCAPIVTKDRRIHDYSEVTAIW